jgi:RNA recognition motif-containing protein
MAKKLYVGNLSYNTSEDSLRNFFSGFGTVASVKIITDRESGNSKGFGFVEMSSDEEGAAAIQGANGKELDSRPLRVNEAMDKPRQPRSNNYGGGWQ